MRPKKKTSLKNHMLYTRLDSKGRDRYQLGGFVGMELNKQTPRTEFFWEYEKQIKEKMEAWLQTQAAKVFTSNIRKEQFKLERKNRLISEALLKKHLEHEEEIVDAFTEATTQQRE